MKILFLGKKNDARTNRALDFCKKLGDVTAYLGDWGDPLPEGIGWLKGDLVVSYLSRWVVPKSVIDNHTTCLNFHPAPPEYPGVGGYNFALYGGVSEYGVTCHHMVPRVDSGLIVDVHRFPILPTDDVASLIERTHDHLLTLFYDVMGDLDNLPISDEKWAMLPRTRKELDCLAVIRHTMKSDEIERRVRATLYGDWKPTLTLWGHKFEYVGKEEPAPVEVPATWTADPSLC